MMKPRISLIVLLIVSTLLPWCRVAQADVASNTDVLQSLGVPSGLFRNSSEAGSVFALPRFQSSDTLLQKLGLMDAASRTGLYPEMELLHQLADSEPYEESHEARLALAQAIIQRIPSGATRTDIETIFPSTDGGAIGSDRGRYYFGSQVMVNVPYDLTGGGFSPKNKVNGPIFVTQSGFHTD